MSKIMSYARALRIPHAASLAVIGFVLAAPAACSSSLDPTVASRGSAQNDLDAGGAPAVPASGDSGPPAQTAPPGTHWMPKPGTSWQWQLSTTGSIDTSFDVQVYDIDLYESSTAFISSLKAAGRKVVCYFDTAYEPGRPDSALLDPHKHNPVTGWPGQYWLDVRVPAVVDVMKARIALAQSKGCDGIEADDVDSLSNNPGTGITAVEQQAFIKTLAAEAHAHGMGYALKSDIADIQAVLEDVDFDINEQCFKYGECDALAPFIAAGKAVFDVEYTEGDLSSAASQVCPPSNAMNFDTLIKHLDLGATRYACR